MNTKNEKNNTSPYSTKTYILTHNVGKNIFVHSNDKKNYNLNMKEVKSHI